jgi:hypothetical protein
MTSYTIIPTAHPAAVEIPAIRTTLEYAAETAEWFLVSTWIHRGATTHGQINLGGAEHLVFTKVLP